MKRYHLIMFVLKKANSVSRISHTFIVHESFIRAGTNLVAVEVWNGTLFDIQISDNMCEGSSSSC